MARRLYLDTYSGELWSRPTRSLVLRFPLERGSTEPIELYFVTDGTVQAMAGIADEAITLTIKDAAGPTGTLLAAQVAGKKSGEGAATKFTFLPNVLSTALDTYLGTAASKPAVLEFTWTDTSTTPSTYGVAQIHGAHIYANVNRGGEVVPPVGPWVAIDATDMGLTLAVGSQYLADTSAAAFTVLLPPSPNVGDEIIVADAQQTWPTNNLTIGRNGQAMNGTTENLTCNVSARISLVFVGGAQGWEVYA